MLYVLFGEDDFSISEALNKLKQQIGSQGIREPNVSTYYASEISLNELIARCSTVPFLAEKRLIIVNDLLRLFGDQKRNRRTRSSGKQIESTSKVWMPLVDYIPYLPETTDLVLIDGQLSKINMLLESLNDLGHVMEFPTLTGKRLNEWIRKKAVSKGSTITPEAVNLLANFIGGNLWALDSEIEKLSLYAEEGVIERQDIYTLVSFAKEMRIFDVVDTIIDGNHADAVRFIQNITDSPPRIIEMIARQIRLCLLIKEMGRSGIQGSSLRKRTGISSDFILRKIINQSKNYKKESLLNIHKGLLDADIAIKTGGIEGHLLGQFLVEIFLRSERNEASSIGFNANTRDIQTKIKV